MRFQLGVLDVDGTLVAVESWPYFHERLGTTAQARRYAELYRRGLITYEEWARLEASLWRGLPKALLRRLAEEAPLVPGAREAIQALRAHGVELVLLSCGVDVMVEVVAEELGIQRYVANELLTDQHGLLTGQVNVRIPLDGKLRVLRALLEELGIEPARCFAVGDDETMVPVLRFVGLGIAFNPRSTRVARAAHVVVQAPDLRAILPYVLGPGKGY